MASATSKTPSPRATSTRALLPLINSRRIELFDLPSLISQICALERSTRHGAAEQIDHPPRGHDDVVNAVAGVAALCTRTAGYDLRAIPVCTARSPAAPPQPTPADRDRAALLARYGQPVGSYLLPRETVAAARAAEAKLPEHVAEGLERARRDALYQIPMIRTRAPIGAVRWT